MSFTFKVADVKPADSKLLPATPILDAVKKRLNFTPEACAVDDAGGTGLLVTSMLNPLVGAVGAAYNRHLPLSLSPDAIWLTISQGFAEHVNLNAEELRKRFVSHEGKLVLKVVRNAFIKGEPSNDWPGVFTEFSGSIKEHIGKTHDLIVSRFSTTSPVAQAASEVVLMDAMQAYFEYRVYTCCGLPRVTLEGTPADWMDVSRRTSALGEFGLAWWTDPLVGVLDQLARSAAGHPDLLFWRDIYKESGGSGGTSMEGWLNLFFPYTKSFGRQKDGTYQACKVRNPAVERQTSNEKWGSKYGHMKPDAFPTGLAVAPFEWFYHNTQFPMDFVGGLLGITQDEDQTVCPAIGWAVRDRLEAASDSTPSVK